MVNYKVCILAGGAGTQMGDLNKNIHSSILPVNYKPVLSYILEKFPKETEIVIAVGHKKETIIDYLKIAYPEGSFTFVESDKYIGPGTGPGYALLECRSHLQCPFIFVTSDTIVLEDIPEPNENWLGIAPVKETEKYCTVKIKNNLIYEMDDKIKTDNKYAFIGLAGIKDYEPFWEALQKQAENKLGPLRDIPGFKSLIEKRLVPIGFTWFDTGSKINYLETNKNFSGDKKFDFSKNDEFLYFVNDYVIKFFADLEIVRKRVERAENLKGLCPLIERYKGNFYSYKKVYGENMYSVINSEILNDFLLWSKRELWKKQELNEEQLKEFREACKKFYYEKTIGRIEKFYLDNNIIDSDNLINGVKVPPLKELLDKIDWNSLYIGVPVRFHGDFTVGNILVRTDLKTNLKKFILLDWRHDFGGLTHVGDLYYDLAKFYKGILLPDNLIQENMFSFDMSGSSVYYDYFSRKALIDARYVFEKFVISNGYDLTKIKIITALALLNMSPLHNYPFNFLVYYLGKSLLYEIVIEEGNSV